MGDKIAKKTLELLMDRAESNFDWNTKQDIKLAKYDSCLASSTNFTDYKLCVNS